MIQTLPKISVIIPAYKVEKYLDRCIQSVLKQTYSNLEIILVDDGSPDKCGEICDCYAKKNSNIKVIHQINQGLSAARNSGIKIASGEFIGFVDSDDIIEPDMYERLYNDIQKTSAGIAIGTFLDCDEWGKAQEEVNSEQKDIEAVNSEEAIRLLLLNEKNVTSHACNKLYRKDVINENMFPVGKVYEDSFVIIESLLKANRISIDSHAVYRYCHRADSIVEKRFCKADMDLIEAWERNYQIIIEKFPGYREEADYRFFWVCFYVLDKIIRSKEKWTQKQEIVKILKENSKRIVTNPYFRTNRKIGMQVLKVNTRLYEMLVRIQR